MLQVLVQKQAQQVIQLIILVKNMNNIYKDNFLNTDQQDSLKDYVDEQAVSGQADVDVGDGSNFSEGEAVIIYDGEGGYESAVIDSISSNVLTMTANLTNTYPEGSYIGKYLGYLDTTNLKYQRLLAPDLGDGSDGAFTSSGDVTWSAEKNYTSITILSGHTITISANVAIKCQGTIDVQSGGILSAKGQGGAGGTGANGTNFGSATDGAGTGGGKTPVYSGSDGRAGGGGGGFSANGSDSTGAVDNAEGVGGTLYNDAELTTFTTAYLDGSGGGGGAEWGAVAGDGGAGGGTIRLSCLNLIVAGEIDCDGVDGLVAGRISGGGGSGGTIFVQALLSLTITGTVHSAGGVGGNGDSDGGAGSTGRIRIEANKIIGTSTPTYATGYDTNYTAFTKHGFYHTAEIKTLNEIVTANAYIKQEIARSANIAGATSSGQKDVIVDDASVYNAGDKVILIEDEKMELHEIDSIYSNTLTLVDNLVNSFTASGDALGIDNYPSVSIEPVGDDESQVAMILQTVENLGDDIWYFTYSKTVRIDNTPASGEAGVRLVGRVRLQGKDNDTTDINLTEINWSFY